VDSIRSAAVLTKEYLVTFGVKPDRPHTGYGYIRKGHGLQVGARVAEFREKPDEATARRYIDEGLLWNSGIFLFGAARFFTELRRLQPEIAAAFARGVPVYTDLPPVSVDYGLLEHSEHVAVVPLQAEWRDLGDFAALYAEAPKDAEDNTGSPLALDSQGNLVMAGGKKVALIGIQDTAVVDTGDALLVSRLDMSARVRDLVARLKAQGDPITEYHLQVHRPWGSYTILENSRYYKIKRVTVKPGKKLSLQMHHHRSEHWVVVSGMAEIDRNGEKKFLRQGESTYVPSGMIHRLGNSGRIPLEVIEVEIGEYLDEADIVRFDDEYGRATPDTKDARPGKIPRAKPSRG
jgi:mannose-1-phosphate guanylyltransferase/mannose-6-phosphate isomerase